MESGIAEGMKRCTKCGEVKPKSEFHRKKNGKDGLRSYCKVCSREERKRQYASGYDHVPRNALRQLVSGSGQRVKDDEKKQREQREHNLRRSHFDFAAENPRCWYSDEPLRLGGSGKVYEGRQGATWNSASVDRFDNSQGYLQTNSILVCLSLNGLSKKDMDLDDVKRHEANYLMMIVRSEYVRERGVIIVPNIESSSTCVRMASWRRHLAAHGKLSKRMLKMLEEAEKLRQEYKETLTSIESRTTLKYIFMNGAQSI